MLMSVTAMINQITGTQSGELVNADRATGRRPGRWMREAPAQSPGSGPSPRLAEWIPPSPAAVVRRCGSLAWRDSGDSIVPSVEPPGSLQLMVDSAARPVKRGQSDTVGRTTTLYAAGIPTACRGRRW